MNGKPQAAATEEGDDTLFLRPIGCARLLGDRHRWHAVRGHLHELDGDLAVAATT